MFNKKSKTFISIFYRVKTRILSIIHEKKIRNNFFLFLVVDCGDPQDIWFNGTATANETTFGSFANLSCETGYVFRELDNATYATVECDQFGNWTELNYTCTGGLLLCLE